MGKRGKAAFKKTDAARAIVLARKAGIEPAVFEIITKDGTTYRITGSNVAPASEKDSRAVRAWADEIERLRSIKGGKK